MVKIDWTSAEHVQLVDWYYLQIKSFFKVGTGAARNNLQKQSDKWVGTLQGEMFSYLDVHLDKVIKCEPIALQQWQVDMEHHIGYDVNNPTHVRQFNSFKAKMESFYTRLFQKKLVENGTEDSIGRWMSRKMGLNVCAYCNHNYTLTISRKGARLKPDFDHFYPKSKYPLLAVSFYNLVPICSTCNSLKGSVQLVHSPYDDSLDFPKFKLYGRDANQNRVLFGLGKGLNNIEIDTDARYGLAAGQHCNMEKLAINDVYKHQIDYVQGILDAAQQYNKGSYDGVIADFQAIGKQPGEIDQIIWGYYRDQHHKRPLSKLTQDVLEQIGLKDL